MGTRGMAMVCALVAALGARPTAQTCAAGGPKVNKPGFRPNTTVQYMVAPTPSGQPFPADRLACVARAFEAWTLANQESSLAVRFEYGEGGIVVRFDDARHLLPADVAGAWSDGERDGDGALERAVIWLSPNEKVLDSCEGVTKTVLHELGHLHGLADHRGRRGTSVMNSLRRKNDRGEGLPLMPTRCDALQASTASVRRGQRTAYGRMSGPTP